MNPILNPIGWTLKKVRNVKIALAEIKKENPAEMTVEKLMIGYEPKKNPIAINHRFVIITEKFGGQSFHALSSMDDFKELEESVRGKNLREIEGANFSHIEEV